MEREERKKEGKTNDSKCKIEGKEDKMIERERLRGGKEQLKKRKN